MPYIRISHWAIFKVMILQRNLSWGSEFRIYFSPKVCRTMAFWAIVGGLGLLFYMLLGFK